MNDDDLSFQLAPVGYLIVRNSSEFMAASVWNNQFGRYCGVDRLPAFTAPDPEIRRLLGETPFEPKLSTAIEDWFDSHSPRNAFIPSYEKALSLLTVFQNLGFAFELIFCQLAYQEEESQRLSDYSIVDKISEIKCPPLGFDISWPSCKHSAIFQPGVVMQNTQWRDKLNRLGLLDNFKDAVMLRNEYLAIYPYPPFDVFLIYAVS